MSEDTKALLEPSSTSFMAAKGDSSDDNEDDSGISETVSIGSSSHVSIKEGGGSRDPDHDPSPPSERLVDMAVQVFFPFMIAGFGMVLAGMLLDYVQVITVVAQ